MFANVVRVRVMIYESAAHSGVRVKVDLIITPSYHFSFLMLRLRRLTVVDAVIAKKLKTSPEHQHDQVHRIQRFEKYTSRHEKNTSHVMSRNESFKT